MTPPAPETPRITAAVVNWNGRRFLPELLRSLRAQEDVRLDILLIDNASSDDSIEYVRESFPEVRVVANRASARLRHQVWKAGWNLKQWIKGGLQRVGAAEPQST